MNGLGFLNIELSSRCNKNPGCWMCGRRKLEKEYPNLTNWGDMDFEMVQEIAKQVPDEIVIQFHNNGESLLHPRFGECVSLFKNNICCMDTNGKLLLEKADEIIGNLDTLTISVIPNDPEGDDQYDIMCRFIDRKGIQRPSLIYRLLGRVDNPERWYRLPGIVAKRILHDPGGSRNYEKPVTIPEIGICLDLLTHLAIDRFGNVSICVRFDPQGLGIIGNLNNESLEECWNGRIRQNYIISHLNGNRNIGLCASCDYYGVPTA